jgi:hypothetical protein
LNRRRDKYSQSLSRSPLPEGRRRFRSRSPQGARRPERSPPRYNDRPAALNRRVDGQQREPPKRGVRERSLSPFSKRLALTQAISTNR